MVVTIPQKGSRSKKRTAKFYAKKSTMVGNVPFNKDLKKRKNTVVIFKLGKNNRFKKIETKNKKK